MQSYGKNIAQPSAGIAESCAESSKMRHFNAFQTYFSVFAKTD
jgi:hypothetical protein